MKTLIITAHPSEHGFSHLIAKSIEEKRNQEKKVVEIINLYAPENHMDYLSFSDVKKDFPMDEKVKQFQSKISASDELFFIYPLWNLGEPAILKNFYDRVFTAGFSFSYTPSGPKGHLTDKKASVFITCDGSEMMWHLLMNPLKKIWKYGRIKFSGMEMGKFEYLDKMREKSPEEKEQILENIKNAI